jgi:hypothetical protein
MRKAACMTSLWIAGCAVLGAAGFWDTKPFTEWTDKEVETVMTDSPWAGKGTLTHVRQGGGLGSVPDWKIVVTLRSALPVRQALVRQQIGVRGTPTAENEALLSAIGNLYVVSISGLPRSLGPQLQNVADAARIKAKGKEPIAATQGSALMVDKDGQPVAHRTPTHPIQPQIQLIAQRGGGGGARGGGGFGGAFGVDDRSGITATLTLGFPKSNAIVAPDQEFDFTTTVGGYNVKRTFKLKDMIFKGELAL